MLFFYSGTLSSIDDVHFSIPTAMIFDDLVLDDDKDWEPDVKKTEKPKKKTKCTYEQTILAAERTGTNDYQLAMLLNAYNM